MPGKTAPKANKRITLFEKINNIRLTYNQQEISEWIQRIDVKQREAIGFRCAAESTQKRQDRILRNYQAYLQAEGLIDEDSTDQDKDRLCFPLDEKVMIQQMRRFFVAGIELAVGRAVGSEKPCYQSLTQWRDAIIFHCQRSFHLRDLPAPSTSLIYSKITEVMRCESQRWNITLHAELNTTHVGLAELRQMIDLDMQNVISWEVTEQHHLAWMIGRICAVRPGSIALTDHNAARLARRGYLCWGDLTIVRGEKRGDFITDVAFREMKTQHNDLDTAANRGGVEKPLRARIMNPQQISNIIFSVTHRILAIALRRGIIQGIDTLDELWNSQGYHIMFKEEFLETPVFLAAKPRGLGVTDRPMTAKGLSDYLHLRGKYIGYTRSITWYSIRRRAATDMVRLIGPDKTRLILGHTANSTVLEEHYSDTTNTTDLSAILLGEDLGARATEMERHSSTLAINAVGHASITDLLGRAMNQAVDQYIAEDQDAPNVLNRQVFNNYRRRVARRVWTSLLSQEALKQQVRLTRADITARIKQCQTSEFMDAIVKHAKDLKDTPLADTGKLDNRGEFIEAVPNDGIDSGSTAVAITTVDDQETAEPDLEDIVRCEGITDVITRRTDESPTPSAEENQSLYEAALYILMQILMQDRSTKASKLSSHLPSAPTTGKPSKSQRITMPSIAQRTTLTCHLCADDETVPQLQKEKGHRSKWHLEAHVFSLYHSARERIIRQTQALQQKEGTVNFRCIFCVSLSHARQSTTYPTMSSVLRHIRMSKLENWGIEHHNAKLDAGVCDEWGKSVALAGNPSNARRRDRSLFKSRPGMARLFRKFGIKYREDPALVTAQGTGYPGVVAGGPSPAMPLISHGYTGIDINSADDIFNLDWELDESFAGLVSYGDPTDQVAVSSYFASAVEDSLIVTRN